MVKEVRPPTVVKPRSSLGDQQPAVSAEPSGSKLPVASSRIPQPSRTALSQRANNQKSALPTKLPTRARAKPAASSSVQSAPRRQAPTRAISPDPLLIASTSRRPPPAAESAASPRRQATRQPVRATGGATPTLNRPDDTFVFGRHDEDETMIGRIALPSDMAALSSSEMEDEEDAPTPRPRPKGRAVTGLGRLLTPQASSQEISSLAGPSTRTAGRPSRPRPPTPESQEVSSQARAPASPPRPAVPSDTIEEYDTPLREPPESTRQKQARLSDTPKANTKRKSLPSAPDTERPKSARKRVATPTSSDLSQHNVATTPATAPRSRNAPSTEPQAIESAKRRAPTPKTQTPNRKRRSSTAERRRTMSGSTPRKPPAEVLASRGVRVGITREPLKPTPGDDPLLLMGASRERRRRMSQTPGWSPQKRASLRTALTEPRRTATSFGFPTRQPFKVPPLGVTEEAAAETDGANLDYGGGASDDDGEGVGNDTFVDVRSRRDLPSRPTSALGEARPSERSRPATPAETASTRLASAVARSRSASRSNSPPAPKSTSPNPRSLLHGLQRFVTPGGEPGEANEESETAELEPTYVSPVASPRGTPHPGDDNEDTYEPVDHEDLVMADGYRSPSYSPGPPGAPSPSMSPPMSFDAPTPNVANALDFDSPSLQRILRGSGSQASDTFSPSGASPLLPRRISRFAAISSDPPAPPSFTAPADRSTVAVDEDADHSDSFDAEEDTVIARQSHDLSVQVLDPEDLGEEEEPEEPPATLALETTEDGQDLEEEEEEHSNLPVARSPSPGYSPSPEPEGDDDLEGDTVIIADETMEAEDSGELEPPVAQTDTPVAQPPTLEEALQASPRQATPPVRVVAEQSLAAPSTSNTSRSRTEPPAPSSPFVSRTGFRFFSPAASSADIARLSPAPVDAGRLSPAPVANRLSPAPETAARRLSPLASAPVRLPPSPVASARRSASPMPPTRLSTVSSASVHEGLDEDLDATPLEPSREPSPGPSTAGPDAVGDSRVVPWVSEESRTTGTDDTSGEQSSIEIDATADTVVLEGASLDVDATADTIAVDSDPVDAHADEEEQDEDAEEGEVDQSTSSPRWQTTSNRSSIADVVNAALAAGMVLEPPSSDPSDQDPPSTPARPLTEATASTPTPDRHEVTPIEPVGRASASPEPQLSDDGSESVPDPQLPLGFRRRMDAGVTPVRPRVSGASEPQTSRRASIAPRVEERACSSSPAPQPQEESTPPPRPFPSPVAGLKEVTPPPASPPGNRPSPSSPAFRTRAASQRATTATPAAVPATAPRSLPASTGRLRLEAVEIPVRRRLGFPEAAEGPSPSAAAGEPSTPRYFIRRSRGAPNVTSQSSPGEGSASTPRVGHDGLPSPPSRAQHLDSPLSLRSDMTSHASPSASLHEVTIDNNRTPPGAVSPFRPHGSSAISSRSPRLGLSPVKASSQQATALSSAQALQASSNDDLVPTTSSSSSSDVEASSPPAAVSESSPERPISPVRQTAYRFSVTPRRTPVPEVDQPGFIPSSPMSPTNLSPALSSRLSSGLTLNFGSVAVGSPSRAARLASPMSSRSNAAEVENEELTTNEAPLVPNDGHDTSLEAPFEEEVTVEAPFEEGDTLEADFEEGDTFGASSEEEEVNEAPQVPTTEVLPETSLEDSSIDEASDDEDTDLPLDSTDQTASARTPNPEPVATVPSASREASVVNRAPSIEPPVQTPVTRPSQPTPASSSRPSSQSPASATRSLHNSTAATARTLSFSSAARTPIATALPRPPLVDYESDDSDDIGANDTIEGATGAWDVTAADVRFDDDTTRAIRFEDAEIDDSRLEWNITAIAPALGAAAAWASPRVASPSSPSLPHPASPARTPRSPLVQPRAHTPVAPPSPAQSSRVQSLLAPQSPAQRVRQPSPLAVHSPARAARDSSLRATQSPGQLLPHRTAPSPSLRSAIPSSDRGTSEDQEEETHRTVRHDAPPPPSDGFVPTSSPAKFVFVPQDEGVEVDDEGPMDSTVLANGHRDELSVDIQPVKPRLDGQPNGHYDEEEQSYEDQPDEDAADDDHFDHGDGDDELGDEDEDPEDETDDDEEVEVNAPAADDGRILLALVPRGIVKVEPNEESHEAPPAPQSLAQQPPALVFPARIGVPSPFVLAAQSRPRGSAQAVGQSHPVHAQPSAPGPSNHGVATSNSLSLTHGPPAEEETLDEPGPSTRHPAAQLKVPPPMPPPPPPPPASWQTSRPRIPSALAQEISTKSPASTVQPSPARSLQDELETAAAQSESVAASDDGSEASSEPFNSVVEIVSTDPFAAARAAAILKVNYEYVEHGILPDGTPGPITRPFLRTASEIAEDVANRSFPDGTVDLQSIVHDAELDLSYRADWSRSPSHFSTVAPDSPLPIPGGWGNRSSSKRKREDGHESTARKKRTHDALLFTRADWGRLDKVYRSERRKWIRECDNGADREWDESRVVEAFIEKQQLSEADLVARWRRDLLADYVAALGRRLTGKGKAKDKQPEVNGADDEPNTTRAELVPPSTIKRVIDWVWGVGTGRKRGSGGVVKRVQTPYVGGAGYASPSDDPYQQDDSHARINYSRSRRSVSVQIPDGAGGLQLRTLDETFDIGDVTMAQTPSRPVTHPHRPLEVASRAPAIVEEEEYESADEAEEAEESVSGDNGSAPDEEEEQSPKRARRQYAQPASREYRYGAGDADNTRRLFAPVYPSLPERTAALTSVVSGTPRPLVKVRSGPKHAIPFPLGGPSSRSALPGGSTPRVKNIARGFEESGQLDLSYQSLRREKEKANVSGLRRVSSRVQSLNESFAQSSGNSFEHDYE